MYQAATGNFEVCGLNTQNTYTLSQNDNQGTIPAGGYHYWDITVSGWEINGYSTPYDLYTNATSITITTPSSVGSATLSVSGDNMCGTFSQTIICESSVPGNPSNNITYHRVGSYTCYYTVSVPAVSGATSYEWADNSGFSNSVITSTNSTEDAGEGDMIQGNSENIYVRAYDGCGHSTGYGYKYITFPKLQNCILMPSSRKAEPEDILVIPQSETISFYTDNPSGNPGIIFPVDGLQAAIQVYSIEGKLIKNEVIDQQNYLLNISGLPKGIYILRASQDNIIINHKFVVVK
jgi:hypothetical protein